MIRDITIGQYYRTKSVVHELDPRTKLIFVLIYVISIFISNTPLCLFLSAFVFLGAAFLTKVPFSFIVRGLKSIFILLVLTLLLQMFFTPGEALFTVGFFQITKEGIQGAAFFGTRLILLVLFTSLMTLTTTPKQLTDGMETLFSPLSRLHVPVHDIATMMAITLRFIPILLEELDKIMKAQQARGADFETGSLITKIKATIPLLIPLFAAAFRRADDLAMAMDSRCYHGGTGRTKMKPLRMRRMDIITLLLGIAYLALIMWL